jgi:6-phosphogluconolactonase (cycloisomerase 2 family)
VVVSLAARRLAVLPIRADGTLGAAVTQAMQVETGLDPRQIRFDGTGKRALVASVGAASMTMTLPDGGTAMVPEQIGRVELFDFDATAGAFSLVARFEAGAGRGPRHLDLHPNGQVAYAIGERGSELFTLDLAGNTLAARGEPIVTVKDKILQGSPRGGDVLVHPNGKFLYVSNRYSAGGRDVFAADAGVTIFNGGYNDLALFELGPDGTPAKAPRSFTDVRGIEPRQLTLVGKDDKFLAAGNQRRIKRWWNGTLVDVNPNVSLFRIEADGTPAYVNSYNTHAIGDVAWVGAVRLRR